MVKCFFCGENIQQGRGIMFVEVSGRVLNFCSKKCRINLRMKRDPKKVLWIKKKKKIKEEKK